MRWTCWGRVDRCCSSRSRSNWLPKHVPSSSRTSRRPSRRSPPPLKPQRSWAPHRRSPLQSPRERTRRRAAFFCGRHPTQSQEAVPNPQKSLEKQSETKEQSRSRLASSAAQRTESRKFQFTTIPLSHPAKFAPSSSPYNPTKAEFTTSVLGLPLPRRTPLPLDLPPRTPLPLPRGTPLPPRAPLPLPPRADAPPPVVIATTIIALVRPAGRVPVIAAGRRVAILATLLAAGRVAIVAATSSSSSCGSLEGGR